MTEKTIPGGRPKGVLANAGWNSVYTLWTIVMGFLIAPLLIRNLGVAQYGIYLLIGSLTGILGVMSMGLGEGTMRYVAYHHGREDTPAVNRVFGATVTFYLLVGLLIAVVMLVAASSIVNWMNIAPEQHGLVTWLVRIAGLSFSLAIVSGAYGTIPAALQRYDVSSGMAIGFSVIRLSGCVIVVSLGLGLLELVLWDLIGGGIGLVVHIAVARRLFPEARLRPTYELSGIKEILGYSVFSFMTQCVHTFHRESGKLLLAKFLGPVQVGYLGAPDNIAQRLHMVVAGASEPLVPRFSANRDERVARSLYWGALWSALVAALILFVPFFVLVPDFLRLWIDPEFAQHSSDIGRLLALYLISQSAFSPVAAYYRGIGKPWFVTAVIFGALAITVIACFWLIPTVGAVGAAWAYFAGSGAPLVGVLAGGFYAFGRSSLPALLRTVALPLLGGLISCLLVLFARSCVSDPNWLGLFALGATSALVTALLLFVLDLLVGGSDAPSKQLLQKMGESRKVNRILRLLPPKMVRRTRFFFK